MRGNRKVMHAGLGLMSPPFVWVWVTDHRRNRLLFMMNGQDLAFIKIALVDIILQIKNAVYGMRKIIHVMCIPLVLCLVLTAPEYDKPSFKPISVSLYSTLCLDGTKVLARIYGL